MFVQSMCSKDSSNENINLSDEIISFKEKNPMQEVSIKFNEN